MIDLVHFRNFRALRETELNLTPFNVVVGPNGSGKTSLVDAIIRLRTLSRLPLGGRGELPEREEIDGPEIRFRFTPPFDGFEATLRCVSDVACDALEIAPLPSARGDADWPALRQWLGRIRTFTFEHQALASRVSAREGGELHSDGSNLAAVLARLQRENPEHFARVETAVCTLFPEYRSLVVDVGEDGAAAFSLVLKDSGKAVAAANLSQGTLYGLAMATLAHDPQPPSVVCIEEIDRGIHPRLFRRIVDVLYALSHPATRGLARSPCQVIVTTHSPFVLDQFRDHPEEIVISSKQGEVATFDRLSQRPDLLDLLAEGGNLGDLWYAGLLGGVPEDPAS